LDAVGAILDPSNFFFVLPLDGWKKCDSRATCGELKNQGKNKRNGTAMARFTRTRKNRFKEMKKEIDKGKNLGIIPLPTNFPLRSATQNLLVA
jgi:hypothetical protein